MQNIPVTLTKKTVTGPDGETRIVRDDARFLGLLVDSVDYSKHRDMRRSMDRLGDMLMEVDFKWREAGDPIDVDTEVSVSLEQLEHLYKVGLKETPDTIRILGGPMRKVLNLIEDLHDEHAKAKPNSKDADGKAEAKPSDVPAPPEPVAP